MQARFTTALTMTAAPWHLVSRYNSAQNARLARASEPARSAKRSARSAFRSERSIPFNSTVPTKPRCLPDSRTSLSRFWYHRGRSRRVTEL